MHAPTMSILLRSPVIPDLKFFEEKYQDRRIAGT